MATMVEVMKNAIAFATCLALMSSYELTGFLGQFYLVITTTIYISLKRKVRKEAVFQSCTMAADLLVSISYTPVKVLMKMKIKWLTK